MILIHKIKINQKYIRNLHKIVTVDENNMRLDNYLIKLNNNVFYIEINRFQEY